MSKKISEFTQQTAVVGTDNFDFIRGGVNYRISFADFTASLGFSGAASSIGDPLGTPILNQPTPTENEFRKIIGGPGVTTSVNVNDGAQIDLSVLANAVGTPLYRNLASTPEIKSLIGGNDINLVDNDDGSVTVNFESTPGIPDNAVIINVEADFPAPVLVGGVLTIVPEEKEYIINQDVTITNPIGFPGAGKRTTFRAFNRAIVTYTGVNALWRDPDAQGEIELNSLTEWQAPNGDMWDITAVTGTWSFQALTAPRFTNFNSMGQIDGGPSGLGLWNVFFGTISNFDQGLVASNMGFFEVNTMFLFGNNQPGCVYFTVDGAATCCSINFVLNTFASGANETLLDIKSAIEPNIDGVSILGNHNEGGINGVIFAPGSLDIDSPKVDSGGNRGIATTRPDGLLSMQGNATNTVITGGGSYSLVAGTWIVERTSQFTGTAAGRLTYDGEKPFTTPVTFSCSVEPVSGTNKLISLRFAKNGVTVANSTRTANVNSGSPQSVTVVWQDALVTNDFVEVFATSDDGTDVLVSSAISRVN